MRLWTPWMLSSTFWSLSSKLVVTWPCGSPQLVYFWPISIFYNRSNNWAGKVGHKEDTNVIVLEDDWKFSTKCVLSLPADYRFHIQFHIMVFILTWLELFDITLVSCNCGSGLFINNLQTHETGTQWILNWQTNLMKGISKLTVFWSFLRITFQTL